MTVWIHKQKGIILITYQVYMLYAEKRDNVTVKCPIYVGDAIENKHGVTFIVGPEWKDDFEYVGEL